MKIGLLGAGTIGYGVIGLADQSDNLEIVKILDKREIPELKDRLTTNVEEILENPEIDTVIELLGGVEPAFGWVKKALLNGKNVVTANKLMISEKLNELLQAAEIGEAQLRFSAAVGGGIPFLVNLLRARRTDRIREVGGILNGTTNYILTRMQEEHASFSEVLKDAQDLGYAEKDPTADISGGDTTCKLMLSSCIAWNGRFMKNSILREGIEHISIDDTEYAHSEGYVLRLIARSVLTEKGICMTVEPTLCRTESISAGIRLVENMAYWIGENAGLQRFTGAGAGRYPTAYAVVGDLRDLTESGSLSFGIRNRSLPVNNDYLKRRYLVRGIELPGEKTEQWIQTEPVSPAEVHAMALSARSDGKDVFFAAYDE